MSRSKNTDLIRGVAASCDLITGNHEANNLDLVFAGYGSTHIVHLSTMSASVAENPPAVGMQINAGGTAKVWNELRSTASNES